ncbi:MAG: hypothetical protein HQK65_01845 [Desulfamplus sp.]|nr:hypothetical protein [Desulfamplus sp.]
MNIYVLIRTTSGRIIDVKFYENLSDSIAELDKLCDVMDLDCESAAIFSPRGLVIGTHRNFEEIFIIANPVHSLGFLVVGHHEPVGHRDPVEALYYLEKKRKEMGCHIGLYQATPVKDMTVKKFSIEEYAKRKGNQNMKYELISEFVEE